MSLDIVVHHSAPGVAPAESANGGERRMRSVLHLTLALALLRAVVYFGRWLLQRQAQQATERLLQARRGSTAVTIGANGAIEVKWAANHVARAGLKAMPLSALEQPKALLRSDRPPRSTNRPIHDGAQQKADTKGRRHGRATHKRDSRHRH